MHQQKMDGPSCAFQPGRTCSHDPNVKLRTGDIGFRAFLFLFLMLSLPAPAQDKPFGVVPSARQIAWHEMDMYVLVHFTPTTFENKEWGFGDADPKRFNPSAFDAGQIVGAVKRGGFRGMILVAKHHDGFCLWPTSTTTYNISKSPWRNGKGDMVQEFEQACRNAGLAFGVYCSPWDRNHPLYGTPEYVDVYRRQLRELYTNYGQLFMSWHDGANGGDGYYGGRRDTVRVDRSTYYGWDSTWAMTRRLQPMATIFSDIGPDVRWVGNEKGFAAETSWATFTPIPLPGKTTVGPGDLDERNLSTGERFGTYWTPAECDVPLRPGWFYHPEQDGSVKTPEQLFDLYLKSVGRGGALDIGIAPDTRGLLHENDVKALQGFGDLLRESFSVDLAKTSDLGISALTDGDRYSFARGDAFELGWKEAMTFDLVRLRENIRMGQRIDAFVVEAMIGGSWKEIAKATSIGACRILHFPAVTTRLLRVRVTGTSAPSMMSEIGVFRKAVRH
jgi:alpha-L-fucosidase